MTEEEKFKKWAEEQKFKKCPKCGSWKFVPNPLSGETVCWDCNYTEKSKDH